MYTIFILTMSDIQIYLDITFNKVGKSLSKIWSTRAIFLSYTEQSSLMFWHVDSRVMCLKMFCLWYEFNTPHEPNLPKADASLGKTVLVCTFSIGFFYRYLTDWDWKQRKWNFPPDGISACMAQRSTVHIIRYHLAFSMKSLHGAFYWRPAFPEIFTSVDQRDQRKI